MSPRVITGRVAAPAGGSRRRRSPMPAPTVETWPNMGRPFVAWTAPASMCCPACLLPLDDDGDRYLPACVSVDCGWSRGS